MKKSWRIRYIIDSGIILETGSLMLREAELKVNMVPNDIYGINEKYRDRYRLIDVLIPHKNMLKIEDAYIRGVELINDLLSRLTLLGYHPAKCMFVSVAPYPVSKGEKFEILVLNAKIESMYAKASLNDIEQFNKIDENSKYFSSINHIRIAQISENPEDRFMSYYKALEQIAEEEAIETIINSCKKCGENYNSGRKATARYIGEILKEYGVTNSRRKKYESMRGKIAHGNFKRDYNFSNKLMNMIVEIEPITFSVVARKVKINMRNINSVILNFPTTKYSLQRNMQGKFIYDLSGGCSSTFEAAYPEVPLMDKSELKVVDGSFNGVFFPTGKNNLPIINDIALPS